MASIPGGLQLLVAIGFIPHVIVLPSGSDDDNAEDGSAELRIHGLLSVSRTAISNALELSKSFDVENPIDVIALSTLLTPNSMFDLVLEMEEPPIEGEGMTVFSMEEKYCWLQWFDGLKEHRDLVNSFI